MKIDTPFLARPYLYILYYITYYTPIPKNAQTVL